MRQSLRDRVQDSGRHCLGLGRSDISKKKDKIIIQTALISYLSRKQTNAMQESREWDVRGGYGRTFRRGRERY